MIQAQLKLMNHQKVLSNLTRREQGGPTLIRLIHAAIKLEIVGILELVTPVFSGDLVRSKEYREIIFKNVGRLYITHNARDPNRGHPYLWYAEYGRGPAVAKQKSKGGKKTPSYKTDRPYGPFENNNKQPNSGFMRYWTTPPQSDANPMKVFAKKVGRARPSFFIRNTMQAAKGTAPGIAKREVDGWLAR